jgi:hypothetical protein
MAAAAEHSVSPISAAAQHIAHLLLTVILPTAGILGLCCFGYLLIPNLLYFTLLYFKSDGAI